MGYYDAFKSILLINIFNMIGYSYGEFCKVFDNARMCMFIIVYIEIDKNGVSYLLQSSIK